MVSACKKKHESNAQTAPQITTMAITNVTATTASSGGNITSNGNADITASGICYSKTNQTPFLTDDTTKGTTASGSFISNMNNLTPGATYYVRAYAINSAGTSYGNVVSFATSNNVAPLALDLRIIGNIRVAEKITARYLYHDLDHDPESGTGFQWYIANDSVAGLPMTAINGATDSAYIIQPGDLGKYLKVGITPRASSGTSPGQEFRSYWVRTARQIPAITFLYNGQMVTYGILTSPHTGREWLDRNLGAPYAPRSYNDWQNYGDLFQWGRKADGHQLINRAAIDAATTPVNGTTTNLSGADDPGHAQFITPVREPFDWRRPQNNNLWLEAGGINNVCPVGWHVPAKEEWQAEQLGSLPTSFNLLLITLGGVREADGLIHSSNVAGVYWTSSLIVIDSANNFTGARTVTFSPQIAPVFGFDVQAGAFSVRCIKD